MNEILSGEKTVEYKGDTNFWHTRLAKFEFELNLCTAINFLCGRKCYKYQVTEVTQYLDPFGFVIDEKTYKIYWEIRLGKRIS
jgi:hypothetical protein